MPMYSAYDDKTFLLPDCSIRKSTDITLTYSSPWLIAVSHVLHRLSVPRHSPCALCSLTILVFSADAFDSDSKYEHTPFISALNAFLRYLWFFQLSNYRLLFQKIGCLSTIYFTLSEIAVFFTL